MSIDKIINFLPNAVYFFLRSPFLYKLGVIATLILICILVFYGIRIHRESIRHHDFFVPNIRVFVEKEFNERTLSFDIESLSEEHIYIEQVQVAIYNCQNKKETLHSMTKHGRVNPLKRGDIFPFAFILDSPPKMGFNFTNVIREHEYAQQTYKVIIVIHYKKNSLANVIDQRFEYLYRVFYLDNEINGEITEPPNQLNNSELIHKDVDYEANS